MSDKFTSVQNLEGAFLSAYTGQMGGLWATEVGMLNSNVIGETSKLVDIGAISSPQPVKGKSSVVSPINSERTITHIAYSSGFRIPYFDVKRDTLGRFEIKSRELATKFGLHWNKLVIDLITANGTGWDGTTFFSTTHSAGSSGTLVNDVSGSHVASLNVGDAAAPTAVEMSKVILDCIAYTFTFLDDAGDPLNGDARTFNLLTSNPRVFASSVAAISNDALTGGETNTLKASGYQIKPILDPRLGSATNAAFQLFRTDSPVKPFILSEEFAPEPLFEFDSDDKSYKWEMIASRAPDYGRWQHALQATLS